MIFVKVNAGLLTLLDAATKLMQELNEELIKNVSNIEKWEVYPEIINSDKSNLLDLSLSMT